MKKVLKWLGICLLIPILLFLLLVFLLYLPPVQNWAVKHVAAYASEQTGMDISVGHVALRFPLDLTIEDLKATRPNDSIPGLRDTIADIGKAYVDVQLKPLLKKKVEIDALQLNKVRLNTDGLIPDLRVKGNVEDLSLECHGVDLNESLANVTKARLDSAKLEICLADTMPPDTTSTPLDWRVKMENLELSRTDLTIRLPGDAEQAQAYIKEAKVSDVKADLANGVYEVGDVQINDSRGRFDNKLAKPTDGLDTNHLAVNNLNANLHGLRYSDDGITVDVKSVSLKEKSGFQIDDFSGSIALDSTRLQIPNAKIQTPDSKLTASIDFDLNTFDEQSPGKLDADIDGTLGKQDIMRVMGGMPTDFVRKWPNQPLSIKGRANGNMKRMNLKGMNISLPTALQMKADGYVANLDDLDHLKADLNLKGTTHNIDFVTALLDKEIANEVNIPRGIGIDGNFKVNGHQYGANFTATEGGGKVKALAAYDAAKEKYSATIDADKFPLQHFLPKMGLSPLTGHIEADGQGTDFMSPSTTLRAKADIRQLRYGQYDLAGMKGDATLANGKLNAKVNSHNPLLNGDISFNALMNQQRLKGTFMCDLAKADLYRLRIFDEPLTVGGCAHLDIDTNLKDFYKVNGDIDGLTVNFKDAVYRPEHLTMDILTRRDTTYAHVDCGDFELDMNGRGGYEKMLSQLERLTDEVNRQIKEKRLDQARIREKLPDANIYIHSGKENFLVGLLEKEGYSFQQLDLDLRSSHTKGLNGTLKAEGLSVDSILLDNVHFAINTDSTGFKYNGEVVNGPDNPQYTFRAQFEGDLLERGTSLQAKLFDKDNKLGLDIGAQAEIEEAGIRAHLTNEKPIIGYIPFTANKGNYIFMGNDKRVSANLKLRSDDDMHILVYTDDSNEDVLQDVTISLGNVDLARILSILPYMPQVKGIANGDFHAIQTENDLSVSSQMTISGLNYEGVSMGDLGAEFVYMPNDDGTHFVDGILISNEEEVGTVKGTYSPAGDGTIDAVIGLQRLPLELFNGFVPDQIIGIRGFAEGDLTMKGSLNKPDINGELYLESTYLLSHPYGIEMQVADDPVRIVNSNLLFENFEVFDHQRTPLNISGYLDFSNLDAMKVDLRMLTKNFMLIDAKENPKSEAFGKAFVNFMGTMRGPIDELAMRGRLDVLGSTDMTYVLRDSPLTTDNRLDELVKFTNFNDSTEEVITRPPLSGFSMDLSMNVDESAHIRCDLNSDHSNYIDLTGGGDLRMQYNSVDDIRLTGRYVLNEAEMKYSLPVIPLKTFTIQEGSYLEFRGDPYNPVLHITATESRKATVENEGGGTRSVNFTCGVVISQTLNDMGLEFTIDAPEDIAISTELASMSPEERGKVAVTMLTTGMYLSDGNTSGFTMNGALSSFLQSEINNITGNALRTLDLSIGVDNATDASGAMHTDYSFKFAKRFWNNRLRVVVGGKVSTGANEQIQNQSFLTNVIFEYRLSATSNQYLKLFYNRDSYDWLEGEIGEYGGGFLWRRKLQTLKDIFKWKNETTVMPPMRATIRRDSLTTDSISRNRHENP